MTDIDTIDTDEFFEDTDEMAAIEADLTDDEPTEAISDSPTEAELELNPGLAGIKASVDKKAAIEVLHQNAKEKFQNAHGAGKFGLGFLVTAMTYAGKATDKANAPLKEKGMMTIGQFGKLVDVTDDTVTNYRNTYALAIASDAFPNAVEPTEPTDETPDFSDELYKGGAWTALNKLYRDQKNAEKAATASENNNPLKGTPLAFTTVDVEKLDAIIKTLSDGKATEQVEALNALMGKLGGKSVDALDTLSRLSQAADTLAGLISSAS